MSRYRNLLSSRWIISGSNGSGSSLLVEPTLINPSLARPCSTYNRAQEQKISYCTGGYENFQQNKSSTDGHGLPFQVNLIVQCQELASMGTNREGLHRVQIPERFRAISIRDMRCCCCRRLSENHEIFLLMHVRLSTVAHSAFRPQNMTDSRK